MSNRLKRFFLVILFFIILSVKSYAFTPLVIPAIALTASLITVAAGVYYSMADKSSVSHIVTAAGDIYRKSRAEWLGLTAATSAVLSVPAIMARDVSAVIPYSDLQNVVNNNSGKYPGLYVATHGPPPDILPTTVKSNIYLPVNTTVVFNGYEYKTGGSWVGGYSYKDSASGGSFVGIGSGQNSDYIFGSKNQYYGYHCRVPAFDASGYVVDIVYSIIPVGLVPPVPLDGLNAAKKLAGVSDPVTSNVSMSSALQDELDKMLADKDYVPSFTDDTTGLPFVPPVVPSSTAIESALAAANKQLADREALASAIAAAHAAAQAAQIAADSAAAHPDDLSLQNAAAAAAAAAAQANSDALTAQQAAADSAAADQAAADDAASDVTVPDVPTNEYDALFNVPIKKSILELLTSWFHSSPLSGLIRTFSISTSDSSAVVSLGSIYGRDLEIDFSRWQVYLSACGTMLLIIVHGFAVLIVVKGW